MELEDIRVLRCLDCGKCTSVCPVARYNDSLSPRRLVRKTAAGGADLDAEGEGLWSCLTCMLCETRCPQTVSINRLMPRMREAARAQGLEPPFTRCGALESLTAIQSQAELPQDRLGWLPKDVKTDPDSKTLLWVGCAPFFDAFYKENEVHTLDAVVGAIRILNALDIAPAVREEERCCGHDALWGGDMDTFKRLGEVNRKFFETVQPELIVTVCPECSLTLGTEYPQWFDGPGCEVKHIAQVVAENAEKLELTETARKLTFQDPCRMGRFLDEYDTPRAALEAVPGHELAEMQNNRKRATCCSGSWLTCNQAIKRIQTDLLKSAEAAGGDLLVTACPKCLIHLKCAQHSDDGVPKIPIRDLADVVAEALTPS